MTPERVAEARASLCGWDRCMDCTYLREALDEIEATREAEAEAWLRQSDLPGCLMALVAIGVSVGLMAALAVLVFRLLT